MAMDLSKKTREELVALVRKLSAENAVYDRKVSMAAKWMHREVEDALHRIAKRKVAGVTQSARDDFMQENQADMIGQRIRDYFGDLLLLNAPNKTVDHLVDAEINWYHLQRSPALDGMTVVGSYQKILDLFVEQFVTRDFRKWAKKRGAVVLRVNDPLEKTLYRVVLEGHILSSGRVYGLLAAMADGRELTPLAACFSEFVRKRPELERTLLDPVFLKGLRKLVESDVLGSKRHEGKISLEETRQARKTLVGDFTDQNSLLYRLLASQAVMV